MSGFNYDIGLKITGVNKLNDLIAIVDRFDGLVAKAAKVTADFGNKLGVTEEIAAAAAREYERAGEEAGKASKMAKKSGNDMEKFWGRAKSAVAKYVGFVAVKQGITSSLGAAKDIDALSRAIDSATGGKGAENIEFLNRKINQLKLPLKESFEGFKLLAGGLRGSGLESEAQRIFSGVASASRVAQLSGEETEGVFRALSQMASKGRIASEELRGQLAERLPGAFQIAASSIGVTTQKLNKMLELGQVGAKDFLPAFADAMEKEFGKDVANALDSPLAKYTDFQNKLLQLQITFGEKLMPVAIRFMQGFLIPAVVFIGENIDAITNLGIAMGITFAGMKLGTAIMALHTFATTGMAVATASGTVSLKGLALAQHALNWAMRANPIGLVISVLGVLGFAIYKVWNTFEGFRGFLFASVAVFKEVGSIIFDYLVQPFLSLGKVMLGVFTLNENLIKEDTTEAADALYNSTLGEGERIASAFNTGWQKGVDNFNFSKGIKEAIPTGLATNLISGKGFQSPFRMKGVMDVSDKFDKQKGVNSGVDDKVKKGMESIVGGGKQQKHITININKLVEEIKVIAQDAKIGADEIKSIVERTLIQAVNSANLAQ